MDILFIGTFMAVVVLTRLNGELAGAKHCYNPSRLRDSASNDTTGINADPRDESCNLPWRTFILGIIST
jgi:hypothetical protein